MPSQRTGGGKARWVVVRVERVAYELTRDEALDTAQAYQRNLKADESWRVDFEVRRTACDSLPRPE